MAIYHLSAQVIGRSSGRSATGAAAYRAGERITDERTGEVYDYTSKGGVEHSEIMAPDNAPEWMRDREKLWNAVERAETRKDAQLAREVEVALPRELSKDQRLATLREFVQKEFVDRGMVADVNVHNKLGADGLERPHAHVMLTTRELMGTGFGLKNRDWNAKDLLEGWRERWAEHVNRALEHSGRDERIDHRSLEAQRSDALGRAADPSLNGQERDQAADQAAALDREPQPKLGRAAALESSGFQTERGDLWRGVQERNALRQNLRQTLREVGHQVSRFVRGGVDAVKERLDALLGRTPNTAADRTTETDTNRDALLGRTPGASQSQAAPPAGLGRDALLARGESGAGQVGQERSEALLGRGESGAPGRDAMTGEGAPDIGSNLNVGGATQQVAGRVGGGVASAALNIGKTVMGLEPEI